MMIFARILYVAFKVIIKFYIMTKSILGFMAVALFIFALPTSSFAGGKTKEIDVEKMSAETVSKAVADIDRMVERLDAINKMDIESLTKEERKELKKEVREIKGDLNAYSKSDSEVIAQSAEVAATGRGLYISGGALIIILLLILIL
jgi:hypothetical protein